jgi:cytosine/adenosine deaminase-related metal-dependent hydrolase
VDQPPLDGGVVTVAGGRIVAVGENTSGGPARDLGDVALVPGFVNAHTHLKFSNLAQPLGKPGMRFADWIEGVVRWLQNEGAKGPEGGSEQAALQQGLAETRRAGVAALGEIALGDWPADASNAATGLELTVFRELLGLAPERVEPLMAVARAHVTAGNRFGIHPGLSPHAPYTVHPDLLRQACELSASERIPIAMHLAESREELELLESHTGPLVELLSSFNAWRPAELPKGGRPLDNLRALSTAHRTLVIHGNYLNRTEIEFLAAGRQRMSLVYCPRTHAYFGHERYPLVKMLGAGVRVAVGTDSRASNPDLRLFEELRYVAEHHPEVEPAEVLRMGTLAGAEALGVAEEFGSITPGKRAMLAVVELGAGAKSPYESLFGKESSRCTRLPTERPSTEY